MNTYYKNIIFKLLKKNYTISIAESCTGGNICQEFTKIPGISKKKIPKPQKKVSKSQNPKIRKCQNP